PEAFGIVSSDADFTPLVMYLRAKGTAVYGFGAQKTPEPFVNACSRFLFLDKLAAPAAGGSADADADTAATPLRVPTSKLKQDTKLVTLLRNAVEAAQGENGWARVGAVGQQIGNQASFDSRNYGYATLTKLLKATELFQLDKEGTSEVSVRDVRQAKTPKS
ncbi:MAG TPA: OST-HTH/LOTUS domain-containing protein, partial [Caldimonas sp.]|nr:OST-HTH/LOTUS domain-containing protein [Caldimonas sp.]